VVDIYIDVPLVIDGVHVHNLLLLFGVFDADYQGRRMLESTPRGGGKTEIHDGKELFKRINALAVPSKTVEAAHSCSKSPSR
jgi:hypothetical protein